MTNTKTTAEMNNLTSEEEKEKRRLDELKVRLGKNLSSLQAYLGWTKARLAQEIKVSGSTITNYTRGERLLQTEQFELLRKSEAIKRRVRLTVDDFFLDNRDFEQKLNMPSTDEAKVVSPLRYKDFVGNYFLYLFDQSKTEKEQIYLADREMIFGVISLYSDAVGADDGNTLSAYARFYSESGRKDAVSKKEHLDKLISESKSTAEIMKEFSDDRSYSGVVSFSGHNIFVSLDNIKYKDSALLIFPVPDKTVNVDYTGGLGCICSISHGNHMPVAQKVIITRKQLIKADDEIRKHLMMSSTSVTTADESERLLSLFKKFYGQKEKNGDFPIDDLDIQAIITKRMNQLVRGYIDKNVNCCINITADDDKDVYRLIQTYAKKD